MTVVSANPSRYRGPRFSGSVCDSNSFYLIFREIRFVVRSGRIAEHENVVPKVFLKATPFEIVRAVIGFVTVLMVYGILAMWARMKRHSNNAVYLLFGASPFAVNVSTFFRNTRSKHDSIVPVDIEASFEETPRPTDSAKTAGFVSREFRHPAPLFSFHNAGYSKLTSITQGVL